MKYFEFGKEHPTLVVMLHGGGVSYRGALPGADGGSRRQASDDHHDHCRRDEPQRLSRHQEQMGQRCLLFLLYGAFFAVMGRPGPLRKDSLPKSPEELLKKPIGSSTAKRHGEAGRTRTTA